MTQMNSDAVGQQAMISTGPNRYKFHSEAIEVSIFDRRGRLIWRRENDGPYVPLDWNCLDLSGQPLLPGDYVCKLVFSSGKIIHVPFIV